MEVFQNVCLYEAEFYEKTDGNTELFNKTDANHFQFSDTQFFCLFRLLVLILHSTNDL